MFEIVYDDGRTPDHEYPISSPGELKIMYTYVNPRLLYKIVFAGVKIMCVYFNDVILCLLEQF